MPLVSDHIVSPAVRPPPGQPRFAPVVAGAGGFARAVSGWRPLMLLGLISGLTAPGTPRG